MAECHQWTYRKYFDEMCYGCNEEFRKWWRPKNNYIDKDPDPNDLIEFVSKRLHVYARRVDQKRSITRCECFNRWGRCRNFEIKKLMGRGVCQFHADRIENKDWKPVFAEDDQRHAWRAKVYELLYGEWHDEAQVKEIMK